MFFIFRKKNNEKDFMSFGYKNATVKIHLLITVNWWERCQEIRGITEIDFIENLFNDLAFIYHKWDCFIFLSRFSMGMILYSASIQSSKPSIQIVSHHQKLLDESFNVPKIRFQFHWMGFIYRCFLYLLYILRIQLCSKLQLYILIFLWFTSSRWKNTGI